MEHWKMSGEATDALGFAIHKMYLQGKTIKRIEVSGDKDFKWFDIFLSDGKKMQFFYTNSDDWTVRFPDVNE